jgi:hypothetical protein
VTEQETRDDLSEPSEALEKPEKIVPTEEELRNIIQKLGTRDQFASSFRGKDFRRSRK